MAHTATTGVQHDEASQWQLILHSFRRHKLAMLGLYTIILLALIGLFADVLAPLDPAQTHRTKVFHPPQALHFISATQDGWKLDLWVQGYSSVRDPRTFELKFVPDPDKRIDIAFLGETQPYKLWGFIPLSHKLIAPVDPNEPFYLLGADRLGRDMLSRVVYATQISMSIGLVGVFLSLFIGLFLGGISGYLGGKVDFAIQRVIELILSLPTIPIWLGMAAALPRDMPPLYRYFFITVILSLVGWTELGRVVRGKILALRHEDFVVAARLDNCGHLRIIFRHIMPSIMSHVIAQVTLAVPMMLLAETSLSFLGLGLLPPTLSWGVLLMEAQNIRSIAAAPWLFVPGGFVCAAVLAYNFLGDGLRDAADPYSQGQR